MQGPVCSLNTWPRHDDVIKWKHSPRYWLFVRGIHRSPVNSPHKSQLRGALMFSLICAWINCWVNYGEAGDLIRHRAHCDVTVMGRGITHSSRKGNQWNKNITLSMKSPISAFRGRYINPTMLFSFNGNWNFSLSIKLIPNVHWIYCSVCLSANILHNTRHPVNFGIWFRMFYISDTYIYIWSALVIVVLQTIPFLIGSRYKDTLLYANQLVCVTNIISIDTLNHLLHQLNAFQRYALSL